MKVIERIKTLLFVGLFISSVVLASIYFAGTPRRESTVGSDLPADVLAALRGGDGSSADQLQDDQLLPEFFGIKRSGASAVGLTAGASMMRDLSELLSPWLGFALGEGAVCTAVDAGGDDAYWQTCLDSDAYCYLRYNFAVPAAVLRGHSLGDDTHAMLETAAGTLPRVREIFIFFEPIADDVCAVSRDSDGAVTLWRRTPAEEDALPTFDDFSIYLAPGVLKAYTFAGSGNADCPSRLRTLPVLSAPLTLTTLTLEQPYAVIEDTDQVSESVLTHFDYNLNKAGSYYESDTGTAVFVETHGTLRASADGILYEATDQGGLSVTDFVRKSSSALNLRDDIIACEKLVAALRQENRDLFGGEAEPQLTGVSAENGTLVLEYAYFYDNIRIGQAAPAIRLAVREHQIVSASFAVCSYRAADETVRAGGQQWMLRLVDYVQTRADLAGTDCGITLCYTAGETDPARLRADWQLYVLD